MMPFDIKQPVRGVTEATVKEREESVSMSFVCPFMQNQSSRLFHLPVEIFHPCPPSGAFGGFTRYRKLLWQAKMVKDDKSRHIPHKVGWIEGRTDKINTLVQSIRYHGSHIRFRQIGNG